MGKYSGSEFRVQGSEVEKTWRVVDKGFYMGDVTVIENIFFTFLEILNIDFKYARNN